MVEAERLMNLTRKEVDEIIIGYLEDNEQDIADDIDGFGDLKDVFEFYIGRNPDKYGS